MKFYLVIGFKCMALLVMELRQLEYQSKGILCFHGEVRLTTHIPCDQQKFIQLARINHRINYKSSKKGRD